MKLLRNYLYDAMVKSNFMPKKIGDSELVISDKRGVKVCEILVIQIMLHRSMTSILII